MITKEILEQMLDEFELIGKQRKYYEDQPIISILRLFGVPEHQSENLKCIPDFLEYDNIMILMPKSVYDTIDFTKLYLPKRLRFHPNIGGDEWIIIGNYDIKPQKIEIKFDYNYNRRMQFTHQSDAQRQSIAEFGDFGIQKLNVCTNAQ